MVITQQHHHWKKPGGKKKLWNEKCLFSKLFFFSCTLPVHCCLCGYHKTTGLNKVSPGEMHSAKPAGTRGSFRFMLCACVLSKRFIIVHFLWLILILYYSNAFKHDLVWCFAGKKNPAVQIKTMLSNIAKQCECCPALFLVISCCLCLFLFPPPGSGRYGYGDDEDWYSRSYRGDWI